MNMFGYIYLPAGDELRDWIKDIFDQISFYGNKVLKLDKEPDTKWFNAFKDLNSAILAFVLKRLTTITTWSGKESATNAKDFFNSIIDAALEGQTPYSGGSQVPN